VSAPCRYLVELSPSHGSFEDIQSLGASSRAASEELSRDGTPVRFLRSVFVPEDSRCLLVFEGGSDEAVLEACRRAGIVAERISEALDPNRVRGKRN
jgi:Nickel responsive protein SCO4226-like